MANEEHLAILKQGMKVWNEWRKDHADVRPELIEADLSDADLSRADFSKAKLIQANLSFADLGNAKLIEANLSNADLSRARLIQADLSYAHLSNAKLSEAWLSNAKLIHADLIRADLRGGRMSEADLSWAHLIRADLSRADLSRAHFQGAEMDYTVLGDVDLSTVRGLETVQHRGPSTIGIDTIYRSQGKIPEEFLRGVGVPDTFITYMHSLTGEAIRYYSCFISYSSKDEELARKLYDNLQGQGVRCWYAPEDLKWGDEIRQGIDQAIRVHDKLLLLLSEHSVESDWVQKEVETAFEQERLRRKQGQKATILFPVRLDGAVMETDYSWAADIRRMRNIGDFTKWKDHDAYQKAFDRLLRDLKAEA